MSPVSSLIEYFQKHEEQAFIAKMMIVLIAIWPIHEYVKIFLWAVIPAFFIVFFFANLVVSEKGVLRTITQYVSLIPLTYDERVSARKNIPYVTYILVALNIFIYFAHPLKTVPANDFVLNNFTFPPNDANWWNLISSLVISMFLHGDEFHLFGNMIFLWAFGTVIERRIGPAKLLKYYLVAGICGALFFAFCNKIYLGRFVSCLGASGAISGLMGLFAVRCYFKDISFTVPVFGIFLLVFPPGVLSFINFNIRMNSLLVIGMFFMADLSGGLDQLHGASNSQTAHLVHLGGMFGGIILAYLGGMHRIAVEEKHLDIGAQALEEGIGFGNGGKSLEKVLEKNPKNAEALLYLARMKTKNGPSKEARGLYERAIKEILSRDPDEALEVYSEYNRHYGGIDDEILIRFAAIYRQKGDFEMGMKCYMMLATSEKTVPAIREKALFRYALLLEKTGKQDSALNYYEMLLTLFPASSLVEVVKQRSERLRG